MESFNEIRNVWKEGKTMNADSPDFDLETMNKYVSTGMKHVKKPAMEYFWGTFVYHNIIYALLAHVFIRFWGDGRLMILSLAGILLYIPFTAILVKKFKAIAAARSTSDAGQTIQELLKHQYTLLNSFFRFKRWFDWIGVPSSGFIFVMILFTLYINGGLEENLLAGLISFIAVVSFLSPFIYAENKKSFIEPLEKLDTLISDMNSIS